MAGASCCQSVGESSRIKWHFLSCAKLACHSRNCGEFHRRSPPSSVSRAHFTSGSPMGAQEFGSASMGELHGSWRSASVSGVSAFACISQLELKLAATTTRSRHIVGGRVVKAAADADGGHAGAEIQGIATTAMSVNSMSRAGWRLASCCSNSGLNSGIGSGPKDWMATSTSMYFPFGSAFGQNGTRCSRHTCSGTICEKFLGFSFSDNHSLFR